MSPETIHAPQPRATLAQPACKRSPSRPSGQLQPVVCRAKIARRRLRVDIEGRYRWGRTSISPETVSTAMAARTRIKVQRDRAGTVPRSACQSVRPRR